MSWAALTPRELVGELRDLLDELYADPDHLDAERALLAARMAATLALALEMVAHADPSIAVMVSDSCAVMDRLHPRVPR